MFVESYVRSLPLPTLKRGGSPVDGDAWSLLHPSPEEAQRERVERARLDGRTAFRGLCDFPAV